MRWLVAIAIAVAACTSGGGGGASPSGPPQIAGAGSCPAAETQDLTFSGAYTGHLKCSTSPATCVRAAVNVRSKTGLNAPISARAGTVAVQLVVSFLKDQPGTFTAGRLGDEPTSSPYGATLDGIGHWETVDNAGTMTLSVDAAGASGTVDIKLVSGAKTLTVKGTWRCVKPADF